MFEKLQRIRAEVERNGKRLEEDQKKYDDDFRKVLSACLKEYMSCKGSYD